MGEKEKEYVSKCCKSTYEQSEGTYCCGAKITESGLCYECHDQSELDGYWCDKCDDWFDNPIEKIGKLKPKIDGKLKT